MVVFGVVKVNDHFKPYDFLDLCRDLFDQKEILCFYNYSFWSVDEKGEKVEYLIYAIKISYYFFKTSHLFSVILEYILWFH